LRHRFLQHFRVLDQIFADDRPKLALLLVVETLRARGRGRDQNGAGEGGGNMQTAFHRAFLSWLCRDVVDYGSRCKGPRDGGLYASISSALTQPGAPTGNRPLARLASWRAVRKSPLAKAACAEARSACAMSPLRP